MVCQPLSMDTHQHATDRSRLVSQRGRLGISSRVCEIISFRLLQCMFSFNKRRARELEATDWYPRRKGCSRYHGYIATKWGGKKSLSHAFTFLHSLAPGNCICSSKPGKPFNLIQESRGKQPNLYWVCYGKKDQGVCLTKAVDQVRSRISPGIQSRSKESDS